MGTIDDLNISPVQKTVNPEIKFEARLKAFSKNELPISFSGDLVDSNGIRFSNLSRWEVESNNRIPISIYGSRDRSDKVVQLSLYFSLTKNALDHIEKLRDKDENKDLEFRLNLSVGTISSNMLSPDIDIDDNSDRLNYLYKSGNSNNSTGKINMLAAQNSGKILEVRYQSLGRPITITSSDWAQNYCPALGVGRFATVDLYMPELEDVENELDNYLNDAIETVQKMENYVHAGEWTNVVEESRKLAEVLREKENWEELLSKSGYQDDALEKFEGMLQNLFQFTSKFVHRIDFDKDLREKIKVEKEDAYFIYTTAIGLVNLLSRKIQEFKNSNKE